MWLNRIVVLGHPPLGLTFLLSEEFCMKRSKFIGS
jgi:hypothetical protein